jgi:hypothetical protein
MLTFIIWVMNLVWHLTFIKQIWYMCIHMAGYSLHTLHVSETLSSNRTREFSVLFTNRHKSTNERLNCTYLLAGLPSKLK